MDKARPPAERLGLLDGVAAGLGAHAAELADIECAEMGRPVSVGRASIEGAIAVQSLYE